MRSAAMSTPSVAATVGSGARPNGSMPDHPRPSRGPISGWTRSAKANSPTPSGANLDGGLENWTKPAAPAKRRSSASMAKP
jgi:hypothetical protein